jgi:hypothetical protein
VTRLASLALGLAVLVPAAGCVLDPEDDTVQFADDFEHGLDGWATAGGVAVVTTYHPGEHAARLAPGASMVAQLGIVRDAAPDPYDWNGGFTDGNWLEYSTECAGRPSLTLEPATSPPGPSIAVRLRHDGPPADDLGRRKLMFPALPAFAVQPDPDDPYDGYEVTFARLEVIADAPCLIDNLRLMVSGGTLAY